MKWLLDTNVVSEAMRPRPDVRVLEWINVQSPDDLAISIVTLAELHDGAAMLLDTRRQQRFQQWIVAAITPSFRERTLVLTLEILADWLRLGRALGARGKPQSSPDLLIAATARIHDLVLVTRNVRDFAFTGITIYNPRTNETRRMESP